MDLSKAISHSNNNNLTVYKIPVADLDGGRAGFGPLWATDRRRHGTPVLRRVLSFDRSTIKHTLRNTQNDCTSGFLIALECTKFVFLARLRFGPQQR